MLVQLLGMSYQEVSCDPILLEDYAGESGAEYRANNPDTKVFHYCEPDKADETNKAKTRPEPRCDYLLIGKSDRSVRFIELKGNDISSNDCALCKSTWAHGFHQLITTYDAYRHCCAPDDCLGFILCTSIPVAVEKSRVQNYKRHKRYKEITQMFGNPPRIHYFGEVDEV